MLRFSNILRRFAVFGIMSRKVFILFLLSGCVVQAFAELSPDFAAIMNRNKLVVATYAHDIFPLFYHTADGTLTGHEIELAKDIAATLGVQLEFDRSSESFDQVIDTVLSGKADLGISLLSITPKRALRIRFSDPYLVVHPVLIVNRRINSSRDKNNLLQELREQKAVVSEKAGTSYVGMAERFFPQSTVLLADDWDLAVKKVVEGEAAVSLRDEIGVTNLIEEHKDLLVNLKLTILSNINDYIGIAIAPQNTQLHYWINLFLNQQQYPIGAKELFQRYQR